MLVNPADSCLEGTLWNSDDIAWHEIDIRGHIAILEDVLESERELASARVVEQLPRHHDLDDRGAMVDRRVQETESFDPEQPGPLALPGVR